MQGQSVLKLIEKQGQPWRSEWLYDYYEYPGFENVKPHRGVRTETHKLIQWYTEIPNEWEMYDLVSDPEETRNLYDDRRYATVQTDLLNRLEDCLREIPIHE